MKTTTICIIIIVAGCKKCDMAYYFNICVLLILAASADIVSSNWAQQTIYNRHRNDLETDVIEIRLSLSKSLDKEESQLNQENNHHHDHDVHLVFDDDGAGNGNKINNTIIIIIMLTTISS